MGIMNSEEIGRQEDGADTRTGSRSATTTYDAGASTVWHVTTFSQRRDSALSCGVTSYSARSSCVTPNSTCSLVFPSFSAGCSGLFHGRIFSLLSPPSLLLHLLRERVMFWCVSDIFAPCGPRWHEISPSCAAAGSRTHTRAFCDKDTFTRHSQTHCTLALALRSPMTLTGSTGLKKHDRNHMISLPSSHTCRKTQHKVSATRFARSVWDITWFAGVTNNVVNLVFFYD